MFLDIYLPKNKPITLGVIYRPPDQKNFIQNFNEGLQKLDFNKNEIYLLGDFNIDLCLKVNMFWEKTLKKTKKPLLKVHC